MAVVANPHLVAVLPVASLVLTVAVATNQLLVALVAVAGRGRALAVPADNLLVAAVAAALGVPALVVLAVDEPVRAGLRGRLALVPDAVKDDTRVLALVAAVAGNAVVAVAGDDLVVPLFRARPGGHRGDPGLGGRLADGAVCDYGRAGRDGDDLGAGHDLERRGRTLILALVDGEEHTCGNVAAASESCFAATHLVLVTGARHVALGAADFAVTWFDPLAAVAVTTCC